MLKFPCPRFQSYFSEDISRNRVKIESFLEASQSLSDLVDRLLLLIWLNFFSAKTSAPNKGCRHKKTEAEKSKERLLMKLD